MSDTYRHNDPWIIDSISGRRIRQSEAVTQWDGNVVHQSYAEPRHPQDFIVARKEEIAVENARPRPPARFIGPLTTTTTAAAVAGATTLPLTSSLGFAISDAISIMLSDGTTFRTTVATVPDNTSITINTALPNSATSGAAVIDNTAMAEPTLP